MIHRKDKMYFISWKDDAEGNPPLPGEIDASRIDECTMINLAVVGNIRPDWFLDKRGDDTDVQYLGDQHVYYADGNIPKLVKQWRKKDFASQYFVMSMMGNPPNYLAKDPEAPVEDNVHWPLILNIPGEGFGDDSLQVYRNHALLTEEDEELFTLIERYEALGNTCIDLRAGENEDVGPPIQEEHEHIPSNLEVDPLSWVSSEITFSPIWEVPAMEVGADGAMSNLEEEKFVLELSRVTVESCYDEESNMMDMSIHFHDMEAGADGLLPWMAIGYRPSDLCAMTPPSGGNTPIIMITQEDATAAPVAHTSTLTPAAKSMSADAFASIYADMEPLADAQGYAHAMLEAPMAVTQITRSASPFSDDGTVSLHFKKEVVDGEPEVHMMYAIGMGSQLGIHATRGCFQVEAPPCAKAGAAEEKMTIDITEESTEGADENGEEETLSVDLAGDVDASVKSSAHVALASSVVTVLMIAATTMFGL
jgi:hypothetical protein